LNKPSDNEAEEKPSWNKYDNIWEIRQSGYPSIEKIERVLTTRPNPYPILRLGRGRIYTDVEHFIFDVTHTRPISLPLWKIILPKLDRRNVGVIYYVAASKSKNLLYRATYGYWGTGPHESALIEACFEKIGFSFDVRCGGYLLNFFLKV